MDPMGDSFHGASFGKGPRPLAALALLFPRGVQDLQFKESRAFMERSAGAVSGLFTDMPILALVQQAELSQQDPSLSSLASGPDVLSREVQVTRVTVPKLRKTTPYELPEAPT